MAHLQILIFLVENGTLVHLYFIHAKLIFKIAFHQLSNGKRHVMPSTDRRLELKAKDIDGSDRLTAGCICQWVKRDREDESGPAVLPQVEPDLRGCTALPVAKGLVTAHSGRRYWGRGIFVHGGYRRHGFVDSARDKQGAGATM